MQSPSQTEIVSSKSRGEGGWWIIDFGDVFETGRHSMTGVAMVCLGLP